MNPSRRLTLSSVCAALALLSLAAATPALATHFPLESYQAFLHQLEHGEVHAVVLHPRAHTAHVSLDDGGHMRTTYPAAAQARIVEEARARGASATVSVFKAKPVHHKLRYIAGGILIVVILVVLVALLIGRRRAIAEEEGPSQGGEVAPAPPAASG
jgi:hypothetical protein